MYGDLYQDPEEDDITAFIISNKSAGNFFSRFTGKIKIALTSSNYMKTLFPNIKEQKPGIDFYTVNAFI